MEFKLKGADTYYNHGSTWIILTDKKQWVIELTKDGTLWYNYYFFQSILTGLMGFEDTVKNENYITEWVENFIQNGVKYTKKVVVRQLAFVDDTIQNGVKHTEYGDWLDGDERFDDIIKNGVKETWGYEKQPQVRVNEVINVGIKETNWRKVDNHPTYVDNIIDKKTLL